MSQPPALTKGISNASKASSSSAAQALPTVSQTQQFFSNSTGRPTNSGSARSQQSVPRSNQPAKPKHKQGKRFQQSGLLDDDERLAMQNIGRRGKTADITHLMNIALPPRPAQQQYHRHSYNGPRRTGGRSGATWGLGSGYHAVDKARYIHANYRFIVSPAGDYTAQAADADVHLDWNNVLQVIASPVSQAASCPICLGEPTAPRMARCGHIFCLACLIRYMHSDDASNHPAAHERRARSKKCPICWDSVYVSETRPVRWYAGTETEPPHEGLDVVLRLMKRRQASTLAMPRESTDVIPTGDSIPWYFAAEVMDYARMMKGSEDYMSQQYDEAIAAVQQLEKEDELMFGEDAEWTGRAIRFLNEAREKVRGIGNAPLLPRKPEQQDVVDGGVQLPQRAPIVFNNDDDDDVPEMYRLRQAVHAPTAPIAQQEPSEEQSSADDAAPHPSEVPRTLHEMRLRQNAGKPEPSEYLFYQTRPHYYLSPLDIRILKAAFGSYTLFPSSILPRVERVSSGHVIDDELRKRVKYVAHLPYGCEVAFLECDWTDLVAANVLEEFKPMLDRRRKKHDEKDAREEKERLRIERAEERELMSLRRRRPSITSDPTLSAEWEALPTSISHSYSTPSGASPGEAASPPWSNRQGSGFASLASPSTSPTVHRTVWGTAVIAPTSPEVHAVLPTDAQFGQAEDGWLQGWERDLMDHQEAELVSAIEGVSLGQVKPAAAGSSGGKKGKKGKKITLMSTTARRGA
ncbi:hypothetical protein BAUCODRAFT_32138 [Baudoinia panamericana UAMH 10762]|uniref:RING-type domain-containing protein n=1 Tax=Baudoinia panamericana (strain UAMH 10762) TaxID=717646 RepID=M2MN84_BAUPA|nr:uncharacterized protein BAUCODRAFT_32138 [Baudoinia panamericana UAMH 10762]EMC98141.1 hypothetical protein BAUCODRAFT_32138 [Baudoinia panamericana UAMH 10762]